jgi:hypothetical protein
MRIFALPMLAVVIAYHGGQMVAVLNFKLDLASAALQNGGPPDRSPSKMGYGVYSMATTTPFGSRP